MVLVEEVMKTILKRDLKTLARTEIFMTTEDMIILSSKFFALSIMRVKAGITLKG